jgi:hypothetical protein
MFCRLNSGKQRLEKRFAAMEKFDVIMAVSDR